MKNIPGFEGQYAITEDGRVWSYPKATTGIIANCGWTRGKWLKPFFNGNGYHVVNLGASRLNRNKLVHRLVALTYLSKPETGLDVVNHKDGNKLNNHFSNLEWCTQGDNNRHAWGIGLSTASRKIDLETAKEIQNLYYSSSTNTHALGKKYGVGRSTIQRVVGGSHGYPKPTCDMTKRRMFVLNNNRINQKKKSHYQGKPTHSKYKGVSLHKDGKWVAYINLKGKRIYLGCFEREIDAAETRAKAVLTSVMSRTTK